jgi:hypothetical protein
VTSPGSWLIAVAVAVSAVSCSGAPKRPPRTRMTVKQIVEKSKPAIVRVEANKERVGTGFAIIRVDHRDQPDVVAGPTTS